jgi:hypothetical protein
MLETVCIISFFILRYVCQYLTNDTVSSPHVPVLDRCKQYLTTLSGNRVAGINALTTIPHQDASSHVCAFSSRQYSTAS